MMKYSLKSKDRESGVALIAVLVMLSTVSLLVMSMAAYSQLASFGIRTDADILRSRYRAEGALNRVMWLLAADNHVYNTTDLSSFDYSEFEEERYLPDGRMHEMDYHGTTVRYRIENGQGGVPIDQNISTALNYLIGQRSTDDEELRDARDIFIDRVNDYIDTDDQPGENEGMEYEDYEEFDEDTQLPRDDVMQFREELWYIPDAVKFFPPDRHGRMSWVNPLGMGGNMRNYKPDLFQAGYSLLTNYANLSHEDAMETIHTIKSYKLDAEPTMLSETFDPTLLASLRNRFTIANSGCYRVTIENAAGGTAPSVRMDATFFDPGIETGEDVVILFYDWLIY